MRTERHLSDERGEPRQVRRAQCSSLKGATQVASSDFDDLPKRRPSLKMARCCQTTACCSVILSRSSVLDAAVCATRVTDELRLPRWIKEIGTPAPRSVSSVSGGTISRSRGIGYLKEAMMSHVRQRRASNSRTGLKSSTQPSFGCKRTKSSAWSSK